MIDTRARAHPSRTRCAFCHGELGTTEIVCRRCHTVLHADCSGLALRCPTFGCVGDLATVRVSPARRRGVSPGIVLLGLAALAYAILFVGAAVHAERVRAACVAELRAHGVVVPGVVTVCEPYNHNHMLVEYDVWSETFAVRGSATGHHLGERIDVRVLLDHPDVYVLGGDPADYRATEADNLFAIVTCVGAMAVFVGVKIAARVQR